MAVIDSFPGVEVAVVVDGKDLHEYQDNDMEDDPGTVTRYVEAISDANFAVRIKVPQRFKMKGDCLSFEVSIDGSFIEGPLVEAQEVTYGAYSWVGEGKRVSRSSVRKFRFSELETVDKHGFGLPNDLERVRNLGIIQIKVCHERLISQYQNPIFKRVADNDGFISEKALKGQAMTHSYSLDHDEQPTEESKIWDTKPIKGSVKATFKFHYKSRAALQDLLLIPRTPSPVPLRERPIDELTEAEKAELIKELLNETAEKDRINKKIKRERSADDDERSRDNKRARSSTTPVHLELNDDDDTFNEVVVTTVEKEKTVITLD